MVNDKIAKIFSEMAALLEMQGALVFRAQAFEHAALEIQGWGDDLAEVYQKGGLAALEKIPGIGQGMAERIEEFLKTGHIKDYERLKKKIPVDVNNLTRVEGVGPKAVWKLYQKLGVKNLKDLERAARAGKIRNLESFGQKSEEKILRGIAFLKQSGGRYILGYILPTIREIVSHLDSYPHTDKVVVAGSVRRMQETIGDVDILVTSKRPDKVMAEFVSLASVSRVVAKGLTKSVVKLANGLEIDLRVVAPESFGAALQYFTGSKAHNVELRKTAIKQGYKLNEYGLYRGSRLVTGKNEEEIYKQLGLDIMPPEIRTLNGELEAAQKHTLPKLIEYGSLKGDLQVQTNWTDGQNSIEEMAEAAIKLGLEYIVITDHTKSLAMTGGADEKKLLRQMAAINRINSKLQTLSSKFKILKGAEVNILKDGSLDIDDRTLARLDVVGAAVHSHFNLSRQDQTQRIVKAMHNPHVDILFHPTGRIINKRPAYDIDIDEIIKTAAKTGTVLEIDAYADRLDLKDDHIRKAVGAGVKLAIDSDAHASDHFRYLELGLAQARRGWATKHDIINAWSLEKMLKFLKK